MNLLIARKQIVNKIMEHFIRAFLVGILTFLILILITTTGQYFEARHYATEKARDLEEHNIWSHNMSDGRTYQERTKNVIFLRSSGEVLYRGACDEENAVKLWKLSPTHAEILNSFLFYYQATSKYKDGCYIVRVYFNF